MKQAHFGIVFLLLVLAIVDESKSAAAATSELGLETEDRDGLRLRLEHGGELLLHSSLADIGHVVMNELNSLKKLSHKT